VLQRPILVRKGAYPRRVLVISVHDYLYANPLPQGLTDPRRNSSLPRLLDTLTFKLNVPKDQIFHLSDAARPNPRPPTKAAIEGVLKSFLETSRAQDRVLVIYIGHSFEIEGEAYLVPIEGELNDRRTLIPLKWVYDQLARCRARQKVLIFDGNRYDPGQGEERPVSGPRGDKADAQLKSPPPGVQVVATCLAGQQSYSHDDAPLGVFLDHLRLALFPGGSKRGVLEGRIPSRDDLIPIESLVAAVNRRMADDPYNQVRKDKDKAELKQVARLSGTASAKGAAYNAAEAPPRPPAFPPRVAPDLKALNRALADVRVPPLRPGGDSSPLNAGALPHFKEGVMKRYGAPGGPDTPVRKAVQKARATLWALSATSPPDELEKQVVTIRKRVKVDLNVLQKSYNAPMPGPEEKRFKARVVSDLEEVAPIVAALREALDELDAVGPMLAKEPPRVRASYDFVRARVCAQIAYLEEYQALLRATALQLPPLDRSLYNGWQLASKWQVRGGPGPVRYANLARAGYEKVIREHRGTPWEVLARRELLTSLGLAWESAGKER
jgi:hypothetical protein